MVIKHHTLILKYFFGVYLQNYFYIFVKDINFKKYFNKPIIKLIQYLNLLNSYDFS